MGKISTAIKKMHGASVYFDTNPIIYFINRTDGFFEVCSPLFQAIESGDIAAFSGDVCLSALLVKHLREHDMLKVRRVKEIFDAGFIKLLPHDRAVFELAASVRASQGLKMIDALHVATAVYHSCDWLVTADLGMAQRIDGIACLNLNDYLAQH